MAIGDEALVGPVEADQAAAVGAEPEVAIGVLDDVPDEVTGERIGVAPLALEVLERVAVEAVQAVLGAEPHHAVPVLVDREHVAL